MSQYKKYQKKYYERNKGYYREKARQRKKELRKWLQAIKSDLACIQCGETHPACLVFHHRNPDEKDIDIPKAVNSGWGKKRILTEIEKCDILCAHCHRKLHYTLRGGQAVKSLAS